jgi:hypothetical protein
MAFEDFDFTSFWDDCESALRDYVEAYPDDAMVESVEAEVGFRLPASYVELARLHNGGLTLKDAFPTDEPTGWAEDHVAISGLYGIGRMKLYSLCGELGSAFMIEEWGYPRIGVCIASTPTAGHEQIMLDYRACGPAGEPQVVYVDQEAGYRITVLAPNFETFVKGLVPHEEFEDPEGDRQAALDMCEHGSLSPIVGRALDALAGQVPDGEALLRGLAMAIVEDKGFFALHADEKSRLMMDTMFWLYGQLATPRSYQELFGGPDPGYPSYDVPSMRMMIFSSLVADPYGLCTGGYAEAFVTGWWQDRLDAGMIVQDENGFRLAEGQEDALLASLRRCRERGDNAT